jgi:glycosyltransferase involved in cell wall biosynthesis
MRIALLGTRGIPARYGGFETFAEELSFRLVERGHSVTVYCRQSYPERFYRGVELVYLPTVRHKYLDTVVHTGLSTAHLLFRRHDAVLFCNAANACFTLWPRLLGMPTVINVDGLERKRKKWNMLGRAWYRLGEWLSTFFPTRVVTDAIEIRTYYRDRYRLETTFIPYGANTGSVATQDILTQHQLTPQGYFLYVSRLEPENNALLVREAFEQVETSKPLMLVGDAPYAAEYIARVRDTRDPRILLPGAIYGQGYHELQSHCYAYIHATEVGGTHPALIEAMGRGALVLFLDTPENREVAGGVALPFTHQNLPAVLKQALQLPDPERRALGQAAAHRVAERYSWAAVTTAYERLFQQVSGC